MQFLRAVRSETLKAITLPGAWAGVLVGIFGYLTVCGLNAMTVRSAVESGDALLLADTSTWEVIIAGFPLTTVGAVIIAVMIVGSEYTMGTSESDKGRQITATLTATSRRAQVVASKAIVVTMLVVVMVATAVSAGIWMARALSAAGAIETISDGQGLLRCAGGLLYSVLMGLIAVGITFLTRSVLVPLTLLIVNSSLVSVSYLLTRVTAAAKWLPDMAGRALFGDSVVASESLPVVMGSVVMAAWAVLLLAVGGWVFSRRDG